MSVTPVKGREGVFDVVVWTLATPESPRRRITYRVEGKRKADKLERDLLHRRDEGLPIDKPQNLGEYLDAYFASRRHEVTPLTLAGYQVIVKRYIKPAIGKRRLPEVTVTVVRKFYADLTERGLAPRTVAGVHRVLSMGLKAAMIDGLIPRNPCQVARPPKVVDFDKPAERGLEPKAAKDLLSALQGTPVYAPAALALLTGLRRGEVLALRWDEVDLTGGELHVRAALEQVGKTVTRKQPKSERSTRTVPLSLQAIAVLRRHRAEQDALRLKWGVFWQDEGYVFPATRVTQSQNGGRIWTPDAFAQAWRRGMDEANGRLLGEYVKDGGEVEDFDPMTVGFHELRHTAATAWLAAGVRVEIVSRRLGHSSSVVTLNVYSHVLADERRDGIEALDSLV